MKCKMSDLLKGIIILIGVSVLAGVFAGLIMEANISGTTLSSIYSLKMGWNVCRIGLAMIPMFVILMIFVKKR